MAQNSLTMNFLRERVLWRELMSFSLFAFAISLFILPFSLKWGMFVIFVIIGTWSKIPGWIHFSMNKMVVTDLFTYIIALYNGFLHALLYIIITMLLGFYLGPKAWPIYVMRENFALTVAAIVSAILPLSLLSGFYVFLVIHYITYYFLVVLFSSEEILTEIILLPAVIFFDFIWTAQGLGFFEDAIKGLMEGNMGAGWPFYFIVGAILYLIRLLKKKIFKSACK